MSQSARPYTADSDAPSHRVHIPRRRPTTTTLDERDEEEWSEGEEDDDPGMFSFLPPVTEGAEEASVSAPVVPTIVYSPKIQDPLSFPDSTTAALASADPSVPSFASTLSPAAAYALVADRNRPDSAQPGRPTVTIVDGARRRGVWQYPESPTYDIAEQRSLESRQLESRQTMDSQYGTERGFSREGEADSNHNSEASGFMSKLDYKNWDRTSDMSSIVVDEAVRLQMDRFGDQHRKVQDEDKIISIGDQGSFNGLDPLDFKDYLEDEEEDSPYPEVRASVSNIDDIEMPCLTFRSWYLGLSFTLLVGTVNTFFLFRYPAPLITPIIVQVVSYPFGKFLAWLLPATSWTTPKFLQRWGFEDEFSFNPGPFNIKEHTIIIIMANAASGPAFALNFTVAAEKFYGIRLGLGFDFLLILTTQLIGFGMAGVCRRFLVWPAALIWPQNLVFCTLLNTLHAEDDDPSEGGVTRLRFFTYVFGGAFLWYILPGFLFQALSVFSFVCWIAPNNIVVNQLFGLSSGLGMSMITFDWSQIAYIGSPLVVPWWAEVNIFVGFFITFWIVAPALYYSNVWYSSFLPMSTSSVFDRFGAPYNTSQIIDAGARVLNTTSYQAYSPLYLPITFAGVYGLSFAIASSILVHTFLYHGKGIYQRIRRVNVGDADVHAKLMSAYPEVPDWWYWVYLAFFGALAVIAVAVYDVQLPVWALLISLAIPFIYILPAGYVFAMTSQAISVNLITELIGGYLIPGRPLGNMLFKVYAASTVSVGLPFVQDLKLGHYMKIPPRATFFVQIIATIASSLLAVGVKQWLINSVPDLCDVHQAALLICPTTHVFYSASIIWGLIGPAEIFGPGKLYHPLLYLILIGAILPVPFWLLGRRYPNSWLRYVNIPVLLTGPSFMPPATGINYSSWFLFGFIFQFWMRRNRFRWWSKFNFILSAGLDSGTVLSGVLIFFALQLPKDGTIAVEWWGNTVFTNTADWNGLPFSALPDIGFFGPASGW